MAVASEEKVNIYVLVFLKAILLQNQMISYLKRPKHLQERGNFENNQGFFFPELHKMIEQESPSPSGGRQQ